MTLVPLWKKMWIHTSEMQSFRPPENEFTLCASDLGKNKKQQLRVRFCGAFCLAVCFLFKKVELHGQYDI